MPLLLFPISVLLIISAVSYSGCDYEKIRSTTTTGEMTVGVDETILPVMRKEADEFMRLNEQAQIKQTVKTSNELIADIVNGDLKTVVVQRDFNSGEKEIISKYRIDYKKNMFALDAVGVIVNPDNPVRKLNFNELRKIFAGEITQWKNLEGDNKNLLEGKIKVFIARKNASIHDFFLEKVMNGREFAKTDVVCSTSTQMLEEVKKDRFSIGFITMSWITKFADTLDTSVKALKLATVDSAGRLSDYIGLHQAYIADRSYPLVVESYVFSTDYSMNVSAGFISFLVSYDGQKIVLNSGLVPVTQPVRIIQLN